MLKFKSVAEVMDFAIAREIEAHAFYLKLAGQVTKPDLRESIRDLAMDEFQHRIRLQAIKAGEIAFLDEEVGSLEIADKAPNVRPHPDMNYKESLILAINREKTAFRIYTNLATIARTPESHDTLLWLAQEEARHKLRLEIEYDLVAF